MLVLFIGRVPVKYLIMLVMIGAMFGSISFFIGQRGTTAINRIEDFVTNDTPFQAKQAYVAIASGGFFGKGSGTKRPAEFLAAPIL